jgi:hypothetical protein
MGETQIMLHDGYGPDGQRVIIYGTVQNLDILVDSKYWYLDGTISAYPEIFDQLYTIHGDYQGHQPPSTPYILFIIPGMSADVYRYVFAQLHLLRFGQKPLILMIDFEMASIVALRALFPTSTIRLCLCILSGASTEMLVR